MTFLLFPLLRNSQERTERDWLLYVMDASPWTVQLTSKYISGTSYTPIPYSELLHDQVSPRTAQNLEWRELIPYDTADLLEKHFDWHYGEDGTEVSIKEKYYLIEYQSGVVNGSFDSDERDVVESEDWLDYFIIKRVDYYLHRSSPMWSLQFASIKAWFPSSCDKKSFRVPCVVYHAPDARSFINVCKNCNLQPLPSGCPLSELIMENTALISEKKDLTLNISKMSETVTNKKRIDLPVNDDQA
ncbi:hypothetical protein Tco_1141631 [Tanacetum coccineum]